MKATLLPDGAISLDNGARIDPDRPGYIDLRALYEDYLPPAESPAPDRRALAEAFAGQWNRREQDGESIDAEELAHAAAVLGEGTWRVERAVDGWHAWPVYEVDDDGEPVAGGVSGADGLSETARAIEEAAAETADPTPAQRQSGNYRKGRCRLHGLPIAIETPRGRIRSGIDKSGKAWSVVMPHHYGHFTGADMRSDADQDHVDVMIGPHVESELAFVVDQANEYGGFDESKVLLGFRSEAEARQGYLDAYEPGWDRLTAIKALPIGALKQWLAEGSTSRPIDDQTISLSAFAPSITIVDARPSPAEAGLLLSELAESATTAALHGFLAMLGMDRRAADDAISETTSFLRTLQADS